MKTFLTDDGNLTSSVPGSISEDIAALRQQLPQAGEVLGLRFRDAIVVRTRSFMRGIRSRMANEEDIAQDALFACIKSIRDGGSHWVSDRHHFWGLLITTARRHAMDFRRNLSRKKRGGDAVRGESAFIPLDGCGGGIANWPARDFTPERVAMATDEYREFLASLKPEVRDVVLLKVEGYTNREIAERLAVAVATVERRLKLVRKKWNQKNT